VRARSFFFNKSQGSQFFRMVINSETPISMRSYFEINCHKHHRAVALSSFSANTLAHNQKRSQDVFRMAEGEMELPCARGRCQLKRRTGHDRLSDGVVGG
jgi:hypothetical protein